MQSFIAERLLRQGWLFLSLASQGDGHENDQDKDPAGVELEDACLQPV